MSGRHHNRLDARRMPNRQIRISTPSGYCWINTDDQAIRLANMLIDIIESDPK